MQAAFIYEDPEAEETRQKRPRIITACDAWYVISVFIHSPVFITSLLIHTSIPLYPPCLSSAAAAGENTDANARFLKSNVTHASPRSFRAAPTTARGTFLNAGRKSRRCATSRRPSPTRRGHLRCPCRGELLLLSTENNTSADFLEQRLSIGRLRRPWRTR